MWFEQVVNWLDGFFNKPLPIVGVSLGIVCIVVFRLLARSSFGKKLYNKVEKDFNELQTRSDDFVIKANKQIEDYKKECDSKVEAIKTYYETMLAQKQAKEDELETLLLAIGDNIHNEKVRELIEKYKQKMNGFRTIMTDKIERVKAEYDERLRALEEKLYGKEDNKTKEE
jgi:tRNA A22 N-methylase